MSRLAKTAIALLIAAGVAFAAPTQPQAASVPQELVEKAMLTTEKLLKEPGFPSLGVWVKEAKGVLIVPSLLKASFIVGAAGGNGVLLARDKDGNWSYPAFYTVGAGSFGLQAGIQDAEVVFVIMTERGLEAVIDNGLKLGLEASMAIGPVGAGVSGATTSGFGADIYAFSKAVGLFGGVSLDGTWAKERDSYNAEFYGEAATTEAILIERKFSNPAADQLRAVLAVE